jgi:putative sterol carrier protein
VARFLSAEWLEEVAAAADGSDGRAGGGGALTVRQVVLEGPEGDVAYSVRVADGRVRVDPGAGGEADVEVTSDYDTAVAISKGELSPAVALSAGRLRLRGNVGLLALHHDAFAALGDVLAPVRAATEY